MPHIRQRKRGLRKERIGPWLLGIDEKTVKNALPVGKFPKAQNLLLDDKPGAAIKRFGSREISLFPTGNAARDGAVFQKTDGSAFLLASDGVDLFTTTDPTTQGAWVLLFSGLDFDAFLEFETAEDKIWMSNGVDPVMSWDGTTLRRYDREFDNRIAGEGGADIDAVAATATTIRHASLTDADDFWNGQQLVYTRGANVGRIVTITDFDAATDELTFTPAIAGAAITDRWKLGLIIPKFRSLRFWDARLWGGSSDTNTSELRFHQLTNPNTGGDIDIDNPLAWPPEFQLDIASADGDRVWGISPVSRDRILAFKQTGLFRIERSALTIYTFEEITKAIGSRFQRSWRERGGVLYFVGQDKDGLPDVFKTDMVSVRPVDPVGGIEPTLRGLRQPNAVQETFLFSSKSDFDAGTLSSWVKTLNSQLESEKIDDLAKMLNVLQAGSNIDIETNPGKAAVLGYPDWSDVYEANQIPTAATPAWSIVSNQQVSEGVAGGILTVSAAGAFPIWERKRANVLNSVQDSYMTIRGLADTTDRATLVFGLWNGSKGVWVEVLFRSLLTDSISVNGAVVQSQEGANAFHTYNLLLEVDGTWTLWKDRVEIATGTAGTTTLNKVFLAAGQRNLGLDPLVNDSAFLLGTRIQVDFHRFHPNFKGNSLSTQGGKIGPTSLPATLPLTGILTLQNDYTRTPDALRRIFAAFTANGGSAQLASFTSDTVDFSTGNDPAGFVNFNIGDVPTSQLKEHLRLRATLTTTDVDFPVVTDFILPFLWLSPPVFIGQNIAAWRTLLMVLTQPAGTELEVQIRETTVTTPPLEIDWAAFKVIVSGDNIGTILGDGVPPSTRQVQLKVEGGPDAAGVVAFIESILLQWNEGSEKILPLHAIVHKKRYQFAAAQATAQENDIIVLADRNDAWMKFFGWAVNFMVHFRGLLVAFNSNDDKILELDSPNLLNDLGLPIDAFIETREENLGDEEIRADLRYTFIHTGDLIHKLDLSLKASQSPTFGAIQTITTGGIGEDIRVAVPFPSLGRRFQRKYRNNIADEGMEIRGETLYYVPRPATP